jgi:hypothetical protein
MKSIRFLSLLILTILFALSAWAGGKDFYVSPRGSDGNAGTLAHPLQTLERARDAVRAYRHAGSPVGPVTVYLRGGIYQLAAPLTLLPDDGGSPACPVTYRAYRNERPLISGGKVVDGWKESKSGGKRIWSVVLPDVKSGKSFFRELWVNGARRTRARHPNSGYLKVQDVPGVTEKTSWTDGNVMFRFFQGDIKSHWTYADAEAVVMSKWVESRLPITLVDGDKQLIHFGKRSSFTLDKGDYYYLENVPEALDSIGEWSLDRTSGELRYLPGPEEKIGTTTVVVPVLAQVLLLSGDPEQGKFVEHLTFQGLTFSYSEWTLPDTLNFRSQFSMADTSANRRFADGGFPQAAVGVPGAVSGCGARCVVFDRCQISHVGTYAVEFTRGCQENKIQRSVLRDLGAGGVKIGETIIRPASSDKTVRNDVIDCEIADGGLLFHSAIGIWIGQSADNRIIHNRIYDFYYSGLSVGWTWGYGPAAAGGNIIELNDVHHIGVRSNGDGPVLSDMGGIYTLGTQPGTVIRKNIFHDIAAVRYGGWGIYFDEGSTNILAEDNLVYRTTHGGFHQHYGSHNTVRNNIFALSRDQQIQRTRAEDHLSFTFEHNIVYWNEGKLLVGNFTGSNFQMDNNIYWREGGRSVLFDSLDFTQWQGRGFDRNSVIADPGFKNPAKGDFSLGSNSPAVKAGFRPFSLKAVQSEMPEQKPAGRSRLLYNMDGTDLFFYHDTISPAELCHRVDEVADAGVTTYLFSPNPGQQMGYPSAVCSMFHFTPPDSTKGSVRMSRTDSIWTRIGGNFAHLTKRGYDPTAVVVDRARRRGLEAFVTFRMNELHDVDLPSSPLLCDFWKKHPEYRVGGYEGWGAMALNYAVPEVRDYYVALLSEVCNRFDIDGLEMDFMRFPYYFPRDTARMKEYAGIMTSFVRRVRAMTEARGKERGRPLLLTARVPSTLKGCAYLGVDPAAWTREHLIDFLTVGPFLSTEVDIPVREFKAACPGIPVYASIEYTLGDRPMTREVTRAAAATLFASGADGMYSFNHFCHREFGWEDFGVFAEIKSPETLKGKSKLYAASAARYPVPNVSMPSQLPLIVGPQRTGTVVIQTAESRRPRMVTLRVESDSSLTGRQFEVTLNGSSLHRAPHLSTGVFPEQYWRGGSIPANRCEEFAADPSLLREKNRIAITSTNQSKITWLYLATQY